MTTEQDSEYVCAEVLTLVSVVRDAKNLVPPRQGRSSKVFLKEYSTDGGLIIDHIVGQTALLFRFPLLSSTLHTTHQTHYWRG